MSSVCVLIGEVYLCDGVYSDEEITRGSRKHCEDFKNQLIAGEYRAITIYEDSE